MKKQLRSEFNSRQYMLAEDFELFYYSDPHFQSVGDHSHPYYEVYLFVEGRVDMLFSGRKRTLRPGDVIIVPPGTVHRAVIHGDETPYRRFVFWLSVPFCDALRAESETYLSAFDRASREKGLVLPMDLLAFNRLRGKLFALLEELSTDRLGRDAQIGLYVRDLMLFLSREAQQKPRAKAPRGVLSPYEAIVAYIADHLEEELSLDSLSRIFYLNKYYIVHLFQANAGLSPHQYIIKRRLSACCEAMLGGAGLAECCARCGFDNYSGFYRAFVREYGVSPSRYLRSQGVTQPAPAER